MMRLAVRMGFLLAVPVFFLALPGGTGLAQENEKAGLHRCTPGAAWVLDDVTGGVFVTSFVPDPASQAPEGVPGKTRREDPGNPVTPFTTPTSGLTIRVNIE